MMSDQRQIARSGLAFNIRQSVTNWQRMLAGSLPVQIEPAYQSDAGSEGKCLYWRIRAGNPVESILIQSLNLGIARVC
jgi:hypothetical protein